MNQCKDCNKQISRDARRCRSCAMQVRGQEPEYRRKMSEAAKAAWARGDFDTPETRRKRSESARARWENSEYRRQKSEAARAQWERGTFDTPEVHHKRSEAMKARWEDPEYRHRMSELSKTRWEDPEFRQRRSESLRAAHARGDFDKPETRHKMSEAAKKHWEDPKSRRKLSEIRMQAWKDGVYDRVFLSPTSIELATTAALDACGLEHITQYRPDSYGRTYDEFVPPNILIEVHGDYWHGPQKPKAKVRDAEKAAWAKENGYHLVIIWEHEIKEQCAQALVIERVKPLLAEMRGG